MSSERPPARSRARPVPGRRLPAALPLARLATRGAPPGARAIAEQPRTGTIEQIARHKRALAVTFRRDGTPVPTPVWAAVAGGHAYVRSERSSGKCKRLRRDARVLLAPCTVRGVPLGAPLEASARVLAPAEEPLAERALSARYGLGRALFEAVMDVLRIDMCFIELTPAPWPREGATASG